MKNLEMSDEEWDSLTKDQQGEWLEYWANDNWTMPDEEWDSLTKDQQGDWIEYWSNEEDEYGEYYE